jgi:hypothetical protein
MARTTLTEDIVFEILEHAWILHSTAWEEEFRPEAFRRYFIRYALVSRLWTIPAERYIYRSCLLEWDCQRQSFEAGIYNRVRGQVLSEFVRIMDISLSHKKLGIPVESLDRILYCCPRLVELRLRIGPEVNTLFRKRHNTERRLRDIFASLSSSLRAIQLFFGPNLSKPKKIKILEEMQDLVCFSNLDLIVLAAKDGEIQEPSLNSSEWSSRSLSGTYVTWPIETNSAFLSSSLVKPQTLRLNTDEVLSHPLLNLFGQELKQIFYRGYSVKWDEYLRAVIAQCQNLERLLVLYPDNYNWDFGTSWVPKLRLYAVERQDWSMSPIQEIELGETSSKVSVENSIGIHSMSHIVGFHRGFPPFWKWNGLVQPRKRTIFDPRTAREAFFGTDIDLIHDYPTQFVKSSDHYDNLFVAIRRPLMDPETAVLETLELPNKPLYR